jgi:hypothetical protein
MRAGYAHKDRIKKARSDAGDANAPPVTTLRHLDDDFHIVGHCTVCTDDEALADSKRTLSPAVTGQEIFCAEAGFVGSTPRSP